MIDLVWVVGIGIRIGHPLRHQVCCISVNVVSKLHSNLKVNRTHGRRE